jgi:hypothetical protein
MQPTTDYSGAAANTSTKAAGDETFREEGECTTDTEHSPDEQPKAIGAGEATASAEAAGPKVELGLALKSIEKALETRT